MYKWLVVSLLALLLGAHNLYAQSTRVRGRVTDAQTGEPISYAGVTLPGTTIGATTDAQGAYSFESRDTISVVEASFVGYITQRKPIKLRNFNQIDFALEPDVVSIEEITVRSDVNPALLILREVIKRREQNDPSRFNSFHCRTYTKMQLDLNNIKDGFRSKRLQRNFGFVFDYADTSALTGERALPVMISETTAELYSRREPELRREIIHANRTSGVNDSSPVAQFTGTMHADVNFYDPFIEFANVRFVSPLSRSGESHYEYYLAETINIEGRVTHHITFRPKRLAVPVLEGDIYIDDDTYALRSASAKMPKGVNVNWVKHLHLQADLRMIDSVRWFRHSDIISAEFSVTNADSTKITSFIGTRQIVYNDVKVDVEMPEEVERMDRSVDIAEEFVQHDENYWNDVRPYRLTEREQNIYAMVDSVKRVPLFRNIYTVINTIIGGYYNTEYIGIGPYYKVASFNDLEGFRAQIGARTTTNVSRRVRVAAYAAYGFGDKKFKGGGSVELALSRRLMRKFTFSARHDALQLGTSEGAFSESNILSSVFSRGKQRLSMVDRADVNYEHEWRSGISNYLSARVQRLHGNRFVPMLLPDGSPISHINDMSFTLGTRISFDENIYRAVFDCTRLGSPYPILSFNVTGGISQTGGERQPYCRLEAGVDYKLKLWSIGYSKLHLRGGKIFGSVPYPLLKLHEGNGTYFYDQYAYSCMDYYEFASDKWLSFFYEHHFNGWLLGRIPLLKRLKCREVITCKGAWGSLSERNDGIGDGRAVMLFPHSMSSVRTPYIEAGVGVENICRLLRVDCIWRLTHREPHPDFKRQNFTINMSLHVTF